MTTQRLDQREPPLQITYFTFEDETIPSETQEMLFISPRKIKKIGCTVLCICLLYSITAVASWVLLKANRAY